MVLPGKSVRPTALICGISGQDGAYLAQFLCQKGYRVAGTSRDCQTQSFSSLRKLGIHEKVELESMAPNDFRSVFQCVQKYAPREIYYLAGQSSPALSFVQPVETFESVVGGVLNLLECIRLLDREIRFYHAGSSEVFGNTPPEGANETTPFQPCSPYGVAKAAAIWLVRNYRQNYDLKACNGILFNHESYLRPERFVTKKIVRGALQISRNETSSLRLGDLEVRRDWGFAPEYVEAMWLMLQREDAEDYVIATGRTFSLREFVEKVFAKLGMDYRSHIEQDPSLIRKTDILFSRGAPLKAKQELGWQTRTDLDGLVDHMLMEEKKEKSELAS